MSREVRLFFLLISVFNAAVGLTHGNAALAAFGAACAGYWIASLIYGSD